LGSKIEIEEEKPLSITTHAVLYVDDERLSLKHFTKAFEADFRILTASSARQAIALLHQFHGEIAVLMTDQNMPDEKGLWLLQQAKAIDPTVVRILATASCDWEAIREAMNLGLFSFIALPWEPEHLPHVLRRALQLHHLQRDLLNRHEAGDLSPADYLERLNTLRTCFGDGLLAGIPSSLK
jgi:DNA-binding NtrC family response regulator